MKKSNKKKVQQDLKVQHAKSRTNAKRRRMQKEKSAT